MSGFKDANNKCWLSYSDNEFQVTQGKENLPVVYVTWHGAYSYAAHFGYDLPNEVEWVWAGKGGKNYSA